jgi:hypothetical protein
MNCSWFCRSWSLILRPVHCWMNEFLKDWRRKRKKREKESVILFYIVFEYFLLNLRYEYLMAYSNFRFLLIRVRKSNLCLASFCVGHESAWNINVTLILTLIILLNYCILFFKVIIDVDVVSCSMSISMSVFHIQL